MAKGKAMVPVAALAAVLLLAVPASAEEGLASGEWGVLSGLRFNTGETADDYAWGWLIGFGAGYQGPDWPLGLGVTTSIHWGRLFASDSTRVDEEASLVELNLGLTARFAPVSDSGHFFFASTGGTIYRVSAPLPPDDKRTYIGPYVGAGWEWYLFGTSFVALEGRFGLLADAPRGASIIISINLGSVDAKDELK